MFYFAKKNTISVTILFSLALLLFILSFSFSLVNHAHAQLPFGGPITYIDYCDFGGNGIWLGPPGPTGPYMYYDGISQSYDNGPPEHEGQYLLGLTTGINFCYHPWCDGEDCPIYAGQLIWFEGSSP